MREERFMNFKRTIIRCVVLAWFALVFIAYYVTFFSKVILGRSTHIGVLGALVDLFGK